VNKSGAGRHGSALEADINPQTKHTKMPLPFGVYRADHVGSFLRPKSVLDARDAVANEKSNTTELRTVEDAAVAEVAQQQIENGLRSVTDGEFRRAYFHLDFLQHLEGIEIKGQTGLIRPHGFSPPVLAVTGKLGHPKPIQVEDFKFLEEQIKKQGGGATTKVCIPSPTMVHFRGGRASIDIEAYPDLDEFFEDLARVYQEELDSLYQAGCRFVQLDDTNLAYLCDPDMRKQAEDRNEDLATLPRKYAALINAAISKRPADMKIGIHLCRGNYRSKWFASGGYEPVAEVLFKELNVDAYFLEYDDARSGDFAPLRHLPAHKVVVLGLMSSKKAGLDDKAEIVERLKQAAEIAPQGLEQLCLSHQCGFSSTVEGNELSVEEQWAKVRLNVEIANEIWGVDLSK
jgi:5-methyltetrahydropteroyltriglutamate--homocysteine methyltransferase